MYTPDRRRGRLAQATSLAPPARRAPNAIFILDMGDRANANVYLPARGGGGGARSRGGAAAARRYDQRAGEVALASLGVPKLASSGGCAERWPVPFALKGYGTNTWQATMREPALGGGARWRWPPPVPWARRAPEAHWRGGRWRRGRPPCLTPPPLLPLAGGS